VERVRCPVCGKLSPESFFTGESREPEVLICTIGGRARLSWRQGTLTRVIATKLRDAAAAAVARLDEMLS